jgi:ankyrin repeat protein
MIPANEIEYWASLGNLARVQAAIASGHDVNLRGENGSSALHAAAENGYLQIIRLLLDNGATIDARLDTGQTPLDLAKLAGNTEAVHLLTEFGMRRLQPGSLQ